jgi:hypothetical protein
MLTHNTISLLKTMDVVIGWHDLSENQRQDILTVVETNLLSENRKPRDKRRTRRQVLDHTTQGYICEYALDAVLPNVKDYAPVTKNAGGLSYLQRKTDKLIDNVKCEIKSWEQKYYDRPHYGYHCLPVSESQLNSIDHAIPLNKYIMCMSWHRIEEGVYRVKPQLIVDTSIMKKLYVPIKLPYSKVGIDISKALSYNTHINDFNIMEV